MGHVHSWLDYESKLWSLLKPNLTGLFCQIQSPRRGLFKLEQVENKMTMVEIGKVDNFLVTKKL